MTVTYTAKVATCKRFGCFWKLLFLWKGSIYKLLWPNLTAYFIMYSALSVCYRFLLSSQDRTTFERLSIHCQKYGELIPVSFVLGFYVTIVVSRWWDQYTSIPWPDSFAIFVSSFINGMDDQSRLMRRTIMRYANLSLVMVFTMISTPAKKRFPTLDHLQEAGFLLPNEKKIFEKMEARTKHPKYWLPLAWTTALINEARRDDLIKDDFGLKTLIDEVIKFRAGCGSLLNFDWISIPLVYTQVVTLAVYTYFLATLMGNQYLDPTKGYPNHTIDLVVPIFTLLQFFFYMGWLLVAETLVNPFGEDDDDFEVNWLIDRNLQISYLIVDEVHENHPDLMKDAYWEEVVPDELPYTEAAKPSHTEPFLGSTRYVDVPLGQRNFILMSMFAESEEMSIKTVIDRGERRETAPVEIMSTAKGDYKVATTSEGRKGSQSSGNSVMRLLKANIYRSASSKSVCSVGGGETPRSKRKKHDSVMSATSRPFSLDSMSNKKDSLDYLEDIFRMSDFSLRGSSCRVMDIRKDQPKKDDGAPSEPPHSLNSNQFESFGSSQDHSCRNVMNIDINRMTSWIENTNSPLSTSFEKLGASFGCRNSHLKGQGEVFMADFDNSGTDIHDAVVSSSGYDKASTIAGSLSPDLLPPDIPPSLTRETSVLSDSFNNGQLKAATGSKKQDSNKGDPSEMIVPLDEQILLYNNSPSTSDMGISLQETESKDEAVTSVQANDSQETKAEANSVSEVREDEEVLTKVQSFEVKPAPSQNSETRINLPAPQLEKEDTEKPEELVFEKPEPSRAIDIPGCAESMEHRSLPVIHHEQEKSSSPKLEEILLSRDPLAQPQPDIAAAAPSQIFSDPTPGGIQTSSSSAWTSQGASPKEPHDPEISQSKSSSYA